MQIVKEKLFWHLKHSKEDFIQDYWNMGQVSAIGEKLDSIVNTAKTVGDLQPMRIVKRSVDGKLLSNLIRCQRQGESY